MSCGKLKVKILATINAGRVLHHPLNSGILNEEHLYWGWFFVGLPHDSILFGYLTTNSKMF